MKNRKRKYTVIKGDLIGSSVLTQRQRKANKIQTAIRQIGNKYNVEFYAMLTTVLGMDEITAVLWDAKASYRICRDLNEEIYPEQFRFAIAQGQLDVELKSKKASKIDGRAFHIASDTIEKLKKEGLYFKFKLNKPNEKMSLLLSQLANLLEVIKKTRSKHQQKIMKLYREFNRQEDVARKIGVSQQAISESLKAGYWIEIKTTEDLIDSFLSNTK